MLKSIGLSFVRQIVGLNLDTSAPGKHLKSQEASVTDKLPTHNSQISTTPGVSDVSSKNGNNEGQRRELPRDFYSKQRILGLLGRLAGAVWICALTWVFLFQGLPSATRGRMNVGTAHSEVNPNTRVMNSRGIWLSYVLGIGLLHVVLLSIPFFSVPVVWTLTNIIHNLVRERRGLGHVQGSLAQLFL